MGGTYPPYVLPCSPGWMQSMISLSARTAETGYTKAKWLPLLHRKGSINAHLRRITPCPEGRCRVGYPRSQTQASYLSYPDPKPALSNRRDTVSKLNYCLDFVADQQDFVLLAELCHSPQVPLRWDNNAIVNLDEYTSNERKNKIYPASP